MAFKKWPTTVAVLGLVALGGLAWWLQNKPAGAAGAMVAGAASGATGPAQGPAGAARPGGGAPGGAAGGPGGGPGSQGPAAVEVGKVQAQKLEDAVTAVGSLRARQGVVVRPEVSGRVQQLGFQDGQRVRRGQLIAQLDDTLQRAQLQQAEAQASIARTNLNRSRELLAQGFVSQSAVDQNTAAVEVANAQVAVARATVSRLRVLAPFDGAVGIRTVNVGDYLKDGADIVNIEDTSSLSADFRLPESSLPKLRVGQAVDIEVEAQPGRKFSGRVDALDSQLDANGRSLLVRTRLANADGSLRSGMFVRAKVVFAVREAALLVPEEALVPLGGKQFIYKVVDGDKGKVAQRVEAEIGARLPGKVEVLKGFKEGDLVVTAGQQRLARGDMLPVRVIDLANAGTPRGARGPGAGASGAASGGAGGSRGASAAMSAAMPATNASAAGRMP